MDIQTAGQQKYYDFIKERSGKLRTGMIVWASLLAVALICLSSNILMAVILAAAGVFLAVMNLKSQKELKSKLDGIKDKEEFFRQLTGPDVLEIPELRLILAKDYVLVDRNDLYLYQLEEMEKVEVGLEGQLRKVLFLTDRQGSRHEIAECRSGDGLQEKFDQVYHALHERMENR